MHSASHAQAASARNEVGHGPDLTAELTVFVTTVGAPTLPDCIAHLDNQDVRVQFGLIDHVAPLPAALQLMVDRCETPYYIQVDEDMLLDDDAVRRLYELMKAEWPTVSVLVGQLYDPHLGRAIEGIKLHRLDFNREIPWTRYPSVFARNEALFAAGYRVARRPNRGSGAKMTFGVHEIGRDPRRVFERYFDLERIRMARPEALEWFAEYPGKFLQRYMRSPDEVDFFALMGVLAAHDRGTDDGPQIEPKDFRRQTDDAFEGALQMWSVLSGGASSDQ